jgi:hypothetical protein
MPHRACNQSKHDQAEDDSSLSCNRCMSWLLRANRQRLLFYNWRFPLEGVKCSAKEYPGRVIDTL